MESKQLGKPAQADRYKVFRRTDKLAKIVKPFPGPQTRPNRLDRS